MRDALRRGRGPPRHLTASPSTLAGAQLPASFLWWIGRQRLRCPTTNVAGEKRHAQGLRPRQLHQRAQGAVDARRDRARVRARGLGARLQVDGGSGVPQDQSRGRRARNRRRQLQAAGEQHHRALSRGQGRPRRPLSQGPPDTRDDRILDGLVLDVNRWFSISFQKPEFKAVSAYYDRLTERAAYRAHGRNGTP